MRHFYDLRISQEVSGDPLGEEFAGYVFKIMGGMDKQGFPMIQGVLLPHRTRLLLRPGAKGYRPRRKGMMKRKSVRGCIVAQDLSVLNLVIVERGPAELPGITDVVRPRRLGPKRASKIRKLFDLDETDDVRKFVVRRQLPDKGEKKFRSQAPKIQRLVTPRRIQRKKRDLRAKKQRIENKIKQASDYAELLAVRAAQKKAERAAQLAKKKKHA